MTTDHEPRAPSRAEHARTLAAACPLAILATLARKPEGYPYSSVTPLALDDDGAPLLVISRLAEHTRNLERDPRCSLLLTEPGGGEGDADAAAGALARGRLTLLGRAARLDDPDAAADARGRFVARHPSAAPWAQFGDFHAWRVEVEAVRWIGGFARMGWLSPDEWRSARPDPLAPHAPGILAHMNEDHRDALVAMVRAFAGATGGDELRVSMVDVDRYGFEVEVHDAGAGEPRRTRLGFDDAPLATPHEVRRALITLVTRARAQLGGGG